MNSKGWVPQSQNTNGLGAEQEKGPWGAKEIDPQQI